MAGRGESVRDHRDKHASGTSPTPGPSPRVGPRFGSPRDHLPYAVVGVLLAVVLVAAWLVPDRSHFEDSWQTWLGIAALVLLVASLLYALRKRVYGTLLGPTRPWYLVHLWTAALWGPLAYMHADGLARGPFYGALAAAAWLSWLTGLAGVALHGTLARQRRRGETQAALLEDLLAERDRLSREIAELDRNQAETCERLSEDALALKSCEAQIALHQLRDAWLTAHIVASVPLVVLVAVHVIALVRY